MSSSPILIVGLGNPGREYENSRHNLGWMVLDELASRAGAPAFKQKFSGAYAKATLAGRDVVLLRPETYMNESGRSVQPAMAFFHAPLAEVVVVHDELDLGFADVRVKRGGGHAGHNGIRSLVQHLGSPDFVRVRIGIGHPPAGYGGPVADWVLGNFDKDERMDVPDLVTRASDAVCKVVELGVDRAMLAVNTKPKAQGQGSSGSEGSSGAKRGSGRAAGSGGAKSKGVSPLATTLT